MSLFSYAIYSYSFGFFEVSGIQHAQRHLCYGIDLRSVEDLGYIHLNPFLLCVSQL